MSVLTFFVLLPLTGCSPHIGGPAGAAEAPKTEVITDKVGQEDVQLYIYADGQTNAYNFVDIRARVPGYLEKKFFPSGSLVKEGDQIALIEQAQYKIALDLAKAEWDNGKARLKLAEANLGRSKLLFESKAISPEEFQVSQAERDMAAASVDKAANSVLNAQLEMEYTNVRSPITGKAARWLFDAGNFVSPSGQSVLISIAQLDPIYVDFKLSDRQFTDLKDRIGFREAFERSAEKSAAQTEVKKEEKPAEKSEHPLALTGGPVDISLMTGVNVLDFDFTFAGKIISQIDNTINVESGRITLRAQLDNPLLNINGAQDYMLYPGQICRVRIPYEKVKSAVLIREEAVLTDLDTKYVLVVSKGQYQPTDRFGAPLLGSDKKPVPAYEADIVQRRDIKIGRLLDSQMRIVLEGLQPDEAYIVKGTQRARIGMEVKATTLEEYNALRSAEAGNGGEEAGKK
ncbi:MAG: efflux RND transporter periplasmic adaptor subunit [Planctomycetaceae bacterium]|nr:efflux RND transporter periplasmic adaptor subunit [Planctomycetaceae bacterium]